MSDQIAEGYKRCIKCGEVKPATTEYFAANKSMRSGLISSCRKCDCAIRRQRYEKRVSTKAKQNTYPACPDGSKRCPICEQCLPATLEFFSIDRASRDNLQGICILCHRALDRTRRLQKKEGVILPKPSCPEGQKRCTNCGECRPADLLHFDKHNAVKSGLRSTCKRCRREERKRAADEKQRNNPTCPDNHKRCTKCDRCLPATVEYFLASKVGRNGLDSRCRDCLRKAQVNYRRRSPQVFLGAGASHRSRKRALPSNITEKQIRRMLRYWHHRCAACGRAASVHYTIAADHWIPLTDPRPDNPGTVVLNLIPLCHAKKGGYGSCNPSKSNRAPLSWLIEAFGEEEAQRILSRIEAYFTWVKQQDGLEES